MKVLRAFLKEAEITEDLRELVEGVITATLAMSVQAHFWHWQTKNYAAHEALGDFYENLTELVDEVAEVFMGSGGEFVSEVQASMSTFDIDRVKEDLEEYKERLVEAEVSLMKDEAGHLHGVGDKVNDLIQEVDKLQYLLTLK